jgi:hypothetical protein
MRSGDISTEERLGERSNVRDLKSWSIVETMWRVEWRNEEQASGTMTHPGLREERKRGPSEAKRGIMQLVGLGMWREGGFGQIGSMDELYAKYVARAHNHGLGLPCSFTVNLGSIQ